MALILYGIGASRTARPLWMLEELGVEYQLVEQTYKNRATRTADFLAINPNGHIPVLDDDGIIVWESMAINLYLANRFGGDLAAASNAEHADTLKWTFWSVTECEKDALVVLFQRVAGPADQRDKDKLQQAESRLAVPLQVLDAHLTGRDYIAASRFTVADVNVASVLAWTQPSDKLMGQYANVAQWLRRCLDRPAQRRVRQMARRGQATAATNNPSRRKL